MGGAKACHLLDEVPAVKKNCGPSFSRPYLHVYGAAHNSGARGPVSSSGPHRAPIVWAADVSAATPRHLPFAAGGGQAKPAWAEPGLQCQRGGYSRGLGQAGLGRFLLETEKGGPPELHLVSCQLLSGPLFTRTHLLKLRHTGYNDARSALFGCSSSTNTTCSATIKSAWRIRFFHHHFIYFCMNRRKSCFCDQLTMLFSAHPKKA